MKYLRSILEVSMKYLRLLHFNGLLPRNGSSNIKNYVIFNLLDYSTRIVISDSKE